MQNAVINLSLCLSDIPKDKIKQSEKNGKKYLSVNIRMKKDGKDQYGQDIYAIVAQTKDERAAGVEKIYIGSGEYVTFSAGDPTATELEAAPVAYNTDDLPF